MKCPKCGYTSFESYDSCRKCSADLVEFKQTFGITPVILPPALCASMASELDNEQRTEETQSENNSDMFSFDLPTEQQTTTTTVTTPQTFSFDTLPTPVQNDPFASLLESTPDTSKPVAAPQTASGQNFELNNFSWDDTPAPGKTDNTAVSPAKTEDDDFNSLFGDLGSSDKK